MGKILLILFLISSSAWATFENLSYSSNSDFTNTNYGFTNTTKATQLSLTNRIILTNIITQTIYTKKILYSFPNYIDKNNLNKPIYLSLMYPGLGQWKLKEKIKSATLFSLFSVSLVSSLGYYISSQYYLNQSNEKWGLAQQEENYWTQTGLIEDAYKAYDKYNSDLSYSETLAVSAVTIYFYNLLDIYLSIDQYKKLSIKYKISTLDISYSLKL